MSLTPDQILSAQKANLETLFGLTSKAFEGVEKLVELNVTASRAALNEAAQHTQAVLSVKDAQELLSLQANLFQPLAEKTAAYSRHLYDIASGTGAELAKAFESQASDLQKNFSALVDTTAKNAPAGSGNRRGRDEERRVGCQQCLRVGAKGRQAGFGPGGSQLHGRDQHRQRSRPVGPDPQALITPSYNRVACKNQ